MDEMMHVRAYSIQRYVVDNSIGFGSIENAIKWEKIKEFSLIWAEANTYDDWRLSANALHHNLSRNVFSLNICHRKTVKLKRPIPTD